jgi:nicotinate-nucleotide adenylyltransferase
MALARAAVRELKLDLLYVVPAGDPPGKPSIPSASPRDRLAMARLAFGRLPRTVVSPVELRLSGPSYSVRTLHILRRRHPSAEWFLVIGGDSWKDFTGWRRWRDILKTVRLAVGLRRGVSTQDADPAVRAASIVLKARPPRASSTDVRAGRGGAVPPAVRAYIQRNSLYS